jgi:hypothetical protein
MCHLTGVIASVLRRRRPPFGKKKGPHTDGMRAFLIKL